MSNKKILILKNDRAGDFFTSLKLISSLKNDSNNISIYLSNLNYGFSFLLGNMKIKKIKFNLNFFLKIRVFFDIFINKYDKVYILTPKSFYFILPLFFKKTKFYAIVYDNKKKLRPSLFLRKFLYKYKTIYRNKINNKSYQNLQLDLLEDHITTDLDYKNLNIPSINEKLKNLLPDKFIFFQFRYLFFQKLGWDIYEFDYLMKKISTKFDYILFSSDIENNSVSKKFNNHFTKFYSIINTYNFEKKINHLNTNIFFLENIDAKNLFFILKESEINLAKEGIVSHISFFHKKKCHNLFNFKINNLADRIHEKISYSEWCKGMNFNFSFLNNDINKASRKILKNI